MKNEQDNTTPHDEVSIVQTLKDKLEERKKQLATFLNNQLQRLSLKKQKVLFLFIGIVSGIIILLISYRSFNQAVPRAVSDQSTLPSHPQVSVEEELVTGDEYRMIVNYSRALDSLQIRNPQAYQKLMKAHPGLPDSITLLINIYQSTH